MSINDVKEEIDIHIKRIDAILPEIKSWLPLCIESFNNTEIVKTIDSFIYRFIKVQDKMGEKLFPIVLEKLQEYKPNMPFIDILNKMERLELISSSNNWIEFRKLRNTLTHDYPDNTEELLEAIIKSIDVYEEMIKIYDNLVKND